MSAVITPDIFQTLARTWCESPEPDAARDWPTAQLDQLAERAVRESMFFLVWSCLQLVLEGNLRELSCRAGE